MRLLPRTLFWRAFAAQMALIVVSLSLVTAFIARDQARTMADNIAAVWAPALVEALASGNPSQRSLQLRVLRDVDLLQGPPPTDAYAPWASPRFFALQRSLEQEGVSVQRIVVSGVTDDSVIWLQIRQGSESRWMGVVSNLEGEDFPLRVLLLSLVGLVLAAVVAGLLSHMVARPVRQLASAVQAFGKGAPLPQMPRRAPTEIDTLARTVAQTFEQRRELDDQRNLMLMGLSHDVRSPLARIKLATELLADTDAETQDLKRRIQHNVEVLDRLVGSFADYVRAEEGPLDQTVDVVAVARSAAASFGLSADSVKAQQPAWVRSQGDLLRRAIDNLLDNALRYGRAPIEVQVHTDTAQVFVRVRNAGEPIDAGHVERLLKPFERGELHRGTPGSGLGLAIAQRIARRHGGSFCIEAQAEPRGTLAVLSLPAAASGQRP
jgi:two-component system, OmpR family, osmolarity sensor histidine kinase EnvZ